MGKTIAGLFVLMSVALSGCANFSELSADATLPKKQVTVDKKKRLVDETEASVERLVSRVNFLKVGDVLVTTVVNVSDFKKSSAFGRSVSDQVLASLANKSVPVREMRLTDHVAISAEGETVLSRETKELAKRANVQAVIVGTYSTTSTQAIVTLKVLDAESSRVIAGDTYAVDLSEVRSMLISK